MIHVENPNPFGVLSEARLAQFEQSLGYLLPSDYRVFLLAYNGGKPDLQDFPTPDSNWGGSLHHVYGLHAGPAYLRLDVVYETYRGRIPETLLPIADDPGGNAICVGLTGEHQGKIYFWNHEMEQGIPAWDNTTYISNSFREFTESLFTYIDPNETTVEKIIRTNNIEELNILLSEGLDIEAEDTYKRTLIENAAIQNCPDIVSVLISKGAKLRRSLQYALQNDNKKVVEIIQQLKPTEHA